MNPRALVFVGLVVAFAFRLSTSANAQVGPDGIDWVTVGAPGNRAYDGPDPFNLVAGRGSVGYGFKIGRTEVTTAQWMEFFNAAMARPDPLPFANLRWWGSPILWGAEPDPNYGGPGTRFRLKQNVANAGMLPVGGISWRQAAILCNWYENNKGTSQSAFMNGAYDVTTFTPEIANPTFTDQRAHTPGARYWIPTLDESMKAVHYDANANGGQGRWWQQPNGTDTPLIYGPPPSFGGDGTGQANVDFVLPGQRQYQIPLGAYPTVLSPWGLLDSAGATAEWIEGIYSVNSENYRIIEGSAYGPGGATGNDVVFAFGADIPSDRVTSNGFRIASSVPAPSSVSAFVLFGGVFSRRSRSLSSKGAGHVQERWKMDRDLSYDGGGVRRARRG